MKTHHFRLLAPALALVLAACLPAVAAGPVRVTDPSAPHQLPADGPVSVSWTDPAQFSDIRQSRNRWAAERGDWVQQLARYFRKSAQKRLAPGQTLQVTITDIKRAGDYEPWHGTQLDDVRFLRDIYPPRITFDYVLEDADGRVLAQGSEKLADLAYLLGSRPLDTDPLRYEKQMIDRWTGTKLPTDQRLGAR
ncbi:MAG: DUF3016 domain-containing protein [Pseudoxanthomonas sp.]